MEGAFVRADGVLRERFTIQRYASTPLETFGALAEHDPGTVAVCWLAGGGSGPAGARAAASVNGCYVLTRLEREATIGTGGVLTSEGPPLGGPSSTN